MILVLGEARSHRASNLGCRGLNHLGDLMFHKKSKNKQKNCLRCEAWVGTLLWWSCQVPLAHSCGLLNHPNSFRGGMFKLNTKFDADPLLYSLRNFECDSQTVHRLNSIYCPQWLVQWSCHCSCMSILVHLLWLPGYISVVQTVLVILIMALLFLDIPYILPPPPDYTEFFEDKGCLGYILYII